MALARLDVWSGCYERAEARYRALLRERPSDVEASAGLADLLLWSRDFDAAGRAIEAGLKLTPEAADLWRRRAQLMSRSGDRPAAAHSARFAEALAPADLEIRALSDRLFIGQARAAVRLDRFPSAYPDILTIDAQAQQQWGRVELGAGAQIVNRRGTEEDVVDGLYSASALYQRNGSGLGVSMGFGAPARAIAQLTARLWLLRQIGARFSGYLAYAFWHYRNDKAAHIFAPALSYALSDTVELELRWWSSYLVLPRPGESASTGWVHAVGVRGRWRVLSRLIVDASYTYGPQLDQTPSSYEFLRLSSHIFGASVDWLVQRSWGVQPFVAFERRASERGAVALIFSTELAAYLRW